MIYKPILSINNVTIFYQDIKVVHAVNISIMANEIVAIIGKNGAGKSSILAAIANMIPIKSGEILFKGRVISNSKPQDSVKSGIVLVPEGGAVFPDMTVLDNLLVGGYTLKSDKNINQKLEYLFALFPSLKERIKQSAGTLSGGERQMLSIGRALMSDPELILLDQPSLGLQPLFVKRMFEVIQTLKSIGKSILLVEQNVNMTLQISDRSYVIDNGKIIFEGKSRELLDISKKDNSYFKL